MTEIAPETGIQMSDIELLGERRRCDVPIVLAEDSVLLASMICESLKRAGFSNVKRFNNGKEAWEFLHAIRDQENLEAEASLIITDIEMPEMDGHRLTKLVKSDEKLKKLPLIIFSSLINEEMHLKGKQLGADEQLSKPEIKHLVEVIDRLLERTQTHG